MRLAPNGPSSSARRRRRVPRGCLRRYLPRPDARADPVRGSRPGCLRRGLHLGVRPLEARRVEQRDRELLGHRHICAAMAQRIGAVGRARRRSSVGTRASSAERQPGHGDGHRIGGRTISAASSPRSTSRRSSSPDRMTRSKSRSKAVATSPAGSQGRASSSSPGSTPSHGPEIRSALEEVEAFVTGARPTGDVDRVLATVLFTDIVDSTTKRGRARRRAVEGAPCRTRRAREERDRAAPRQRHPHDRRRVPRHLRRSRPCRAVRAGDRGGASRALGIEIRAGCIPARWVRGR